MTKKTLTVLRAEAQVIRDETGTGLNTASRVGTFLDDFLDSHDTLNGDLWEFKLDGSYPNVGTPLAIAAGVRTKISIASAGGEILRSPNHTGDIWNQTTQKFQPLAANDFYTMRFAVSGQSDVASVNRFEVELDVGGSFPIIASETGVFAKGAANAQSFNFSAGFFAGGDFLTNGAEIYITPLADASFWQLAVTISRNYTPQP